MKRIFKLYKSPILVTSLLVTGILVWGWLEGQEAQALYMEKLQGESRGVFRSLEGVFDSLNKHSPYNLDHLTIILNGVIRASGLRFAVIQVNGRMIVQAGEVPSNFSVDSPRGESTADGCFTAWKPIQLKQTLEYYSEEMKGSPILVVGLSMDRFFKDHLRSLRELWIKLIIGFVGIISAGIIWVLSIQARLLSSELDVTKIQKDHFEELGMASAGLAHESKNPLGIIRGLAQRIGKETEGDPGVRKMSEQIMDEVDRTSARLGEFMSYAKNREPEIRPVEVGKIFENIKAVLDPDFQQAEIALEIETDFITISADEDMFRQVLINLLLNSLKASEKGTKVQVRILQVKKEVVMEVSDEGRGIAPDILKEMFKPYVSGTEGGHGLGLAIVHRITEQHGWTVEAESEEGRGTVIRILNIQKAE